MLKRILFAILAIVVVCVLGGFYAPKEKQFVFEYSNPNIVDRNVSRVDISSNTRTIPGYDSFRSFSEIGEYISEKQCYEIARKEIDKYIDVSECEIPVLSDDVDENEGVTSSPEYRFTFPKYINGVCVSCSSVQVYKDGVISDVVVASDVSLSRKQKSDLQYLSSDEAEAAVLDKAQQLVANKEYYKQNIYITGKSLQVDEKGKVWVVYNIGCTTYLDEMAYYEEQLSVIYLSYC